MGAITAVIESIPWNILNSVFLLAIILLLILIARRLDSTARRDTAVIVKEQGNAVKEKNDKAEQYMKEVRDLINLERLKFLEQLEFFYKNRPDEIKPRFGLDRPQNEQRFLADLAASRLKLSRKVFEDIVRASRTV